ncbi:serine/threonine-protein phosphatase [Proteus mirabilis]|nr:serine/threonine-protein phosphatase [Proteus mirabilis]EGT3589792.1 serine/threonine-protein phosphatase [Proteus mirabilis]MBN7189427.1 serine/threonine-protein phosphatase [Proteus mirabilis]MBN7243471.1 serine/threonine-protein phosphatase [Proteus mirabilis]MCT0069461.1 serine/threonine-protein phosphatase [Proteus mirabilis]
MMKLLSTLSFSFAKEKGRMNEDSILPLKFLDDGFLMAVADGVGSYSGAEVISEEVIKTLNEVTSLELLNQTSDIFYKLNNKLNELALKDKRLSEAATTLTFCYLNSSGLLVGHIGDCRLYIQNGVKLKQLTKDHTKHQLLIDQKIYSAKQLRDLPGKNILTKAISLRVPLEPDVFFIPLNELPKNNQKMTLYIMSDGAHHFWEKRPKFSENTMNNLVKFTNGLFRRIEKNGPTDDYSLVGAEFKL